MFQLTELLLCQSNNMCHHSSLVQLIQLMSYTAESGDQTQGLVVLQCKWYTFPFILSQLLTELLWQRKTFQLWPDCIVSIPHQLYGQVSVTELCPPKLRKPKPHHLARWHSFSPRAFQPLHLCGNALPLFTEEGSPPPHSLLSSPTSPTLSWAGRWSSWLQVS